MADVVYLLCAAQGLLMFAVLWSRRQNQLANRLLAAAIVTIAISCVYVLYAHSDLPRTHPRWLFAIDTLPALYGPLFYLYARALTGQISSGKRESIHVLPFVLFTLWDSPRLFRAPELKLEAYLHGAGDARYVFAALLIDLLGVVYFVAALWSVHTYRRALVAQFSNLDRKTLRWLSGLLSVLLVLWLGSMSGYVMEHSLLVYVHMSLAIVMYVIAYLNAVQPQLFVRISARTTPPSAAAPDVEPRVEPAESPLKYQKTRLRDEQTQAIAARISQLFEDERPYLNPEFTLTALAERLEIPAHHVSQVLNDHFAKSFYDMVNAHRVKELKRRLSDPQHSAEKILSIGLDCGFSSKSTLNANFKKHTGLTPREYRDQLVK